MKLYDFPRSSAAYRVRIALAYKGLSPDVLPIDILAGGDQHSPEYGAINPQRLVPALQLGDGRVLTQSLAIIEYIDEIQPEPPLLPRDPTGRALARSLALAIACDVHPFGTPRVADYLRREWGRSDTEIRAWTRHWIAGGLTAVEQLLSQSPARRFAAADHPTLADIAIVPQYANAERFDIKSDLFPRVAGIAARCRELPAFIAAAAAAPASAA